MSAVSYVLERDDTIRNHIEVVTVLCFLKFESIDGTFHENLIEGIFSRLLISNSAESEPVPCKGHMKIILTFSNTGGIATPARN